VLAARQRRALGALPSRRSGGRWLPTADQFGKFWLRDTGTWTKVVKFAAAKRDQGGLAARLNIFRLLCDRSLGRLP
jgi:hypothetical protein